MTQFYQISCSCGNRMRVSEKHFGLTGACPRCGVAIAISEENIDTTLISSSGLVPGNGPSEMDVPADWTPGDIILDLYEVNGVLGTGGMGKVFKVRHCQWNIDLAVKCPRPEILSRAKGVEYVERECETWINLGLHPHIVSCYYVRRLGGIPRIFAEYVDGGSLLAWIRDGRLYEGGANRSIERILRVAIQVAWGLQHAHAHRLIHRDVKPANVMMTSDGVAKVTDFGLAQALAAVDLEGATPGNPLASSRGMTPAYCSPEQHAHAPLTHRTDMWSWALLVLEMFTRKATWRIGTAGTEALTAYMSQSVPDPRAPSMPAHLATLLKACLQQQPEARPASMQEIADVLARIYKETTGMPYPQPPPKAVGALPSTLNNRAISMLDLGKRSEAEKLWAQALQEETHHPESVYNYGLVRWRQGTVSDTALVQQLTEVAQHHAQDWLSPFLLAHVHMERGDYEAAVHLLESKVVTSADQEAANVLLKTAKGRLPFARKALRILEGHVDAVNALSVIADGKYLLSGSEDNTLRLWELASGRCMRIYEGHTGSVDAIAVSANGQFAVSASRDRSFRIWDLMAGKCVRVIETHRDATRSVCLAPNGRQILTRGADNSLQLWELSTGTVARTLAGHADWVKAICFSPAGRYALSGSADGTLRLWEVDGALCLRIFEGHVGAVEAIALSEDGAYALSGGADRTLRLWEVATGKCLRVMSGHTDSVLSIALSQNAKLAVSGGPDRTVRVWEVEAGRCLCTFAGHGDSVLAVALTPDGRYALSSGRDRTVRVWDLGPLAMRYVAPLIVCQAQRSEAILSTGIAFKQLVLQAQQLLERGDAVRAAAAIRQARVLPGFGRRNEALGEWARLYRRLPRTLLAGGWEGASFDGHAGAVKSIRLSGDGRYAVSGGADGMVKIWNMSSGKCLRTLKVRHGAVHSVACSVEGRFLVAGGEDGLIQMWDAVQGDQIQTFEGFTGTVETLALSLDGRFLVSAGLDIWIWDVATAEPLRTLEGHSSDIVSLCLSPDSLSLLSGSSDQNVALWDIASGNSLMTLAGHAGGVRTVSLSEDGRFALSGSGNMWGRPGELFLWNLETGECLHSFEGHASSVNAACLTTDCRYAVSGSSDRTVKLWETSSGECVRVFQGHADAVEALGMSRDGRYVLSGSADGKMIQWILDWELEEREREDWDEGARPYLEAFLTLHTPYAADVSQEGPQSEEEATLALTHRGKPEWNDEDFRRLMYTLGCAGYGWLTQEGVQQQLEKISARRKWSSFFVGKWGKRTR
ncbi:MAG TPA: serine/threonine-protein kinase [Candidatus Hydrogenedentes bacterium]|nr:serine/threonine-protein kinase [Candidatus Hydrogenedentota bacterium]